MSSDKIQIDYGDTPEKLHEAADEAISFLVTHLQKRNDIEAECIRLYLYAQQGVHIKGRPKDWDGILALYRKGCEELLPTFCSQEVMARGYARCLSYGDTSGGVKATICGEYAYLTQGCKLTITMKSNKRAVIHTSFQRPRMGEQQFTLSRTDGRWLLTDKRDKAWGKWTKNSI